MPRKRPRNPLKRSHPEFDAPPDININAKSDDAYANKKKKKKHTKTHEDPSTSTKDDMSGGSTPKDFDRIVNWQKYAQQSALRKEKEREQQEKRKRELARKKNESLAEYNKRINEVIAIPKVKGETKKKNKPKKKASSNEDENSDDDNFRPSRKRDTSPDPWAHLNENRPKFGEIADRPPELNLPTKLLRNVPKSAGSLARREMLEDERTRVIESYRRLMEEKRLNIRN